MITRVSLDMRYFELLYFYFMTMLEAYTRPSIVAGSRLGGDPALTMGPDDRVGVPVGDIGRDARHGEHGCRRGQADGAVSHSRKLCSPSR